MPSAPLKDTPGVIRSAISQGRFPSGSRLPSERDLAALMQVSRATVNLELNALEREGLVRRASGYIRMVSGTAQTATARTHAVSGIAVLTDQVPKEGDRRLFFIQQLAFAAIRQLLSGGEALSMVPVEDNTDWGGLLGQSPRAWLLLDRVLEVMPSQVRRAFFVDCARRSIPVIAFADGLPSDEAAGCPIDLVGSAQADGQALLVKRLYRDGARRILLLGRDHQDLLTWESERRRGFAEACVALGLPARPVLPVAMGTFACDPERAFRAQVRLHVGLLHEAMAQDGPFDAVCCSGDGEVSVMAAACRLLGLDDAICGRLTGFDHYWNPNLPEMAWEKPTAPLATIDRAPEAIAEAMLEALRRRHAQPDLPAQRIIVPGRLVERSELFPESGTSMNTLQARGTASTASARLTQEPT